MNQTPCVLHVLEMQCQYLFTPFLSFGIFLLHALVLDCVSAGRYSDIVTSMYMYVVISVILIAEACIAFFSRFPQG